MPVLRTQQNPERKSLTLTARFDAAPDRVWSVWADPRRLERWWGPPTYPATFVDHDLTPGGRMAYYMTSPEGEKYHGWWRILTVQRPSLIEFEDGFADGNGDPNPDLPVTIARVTFTATDAGGTEMTIESVYPTIEAMEQVLAMGMEEGITMAVNQIDALLAEAAA
jgi:uncharacterized protein YndB with AHSA1/START domain